MIKFLDLKKNTEPYIREIQENVNRVVCSGYYLQGDEVHNFEQNYAQFIGTKFCISCASGLDSLYLIFRAYIELGFISLGDEVIVPANTFIASILAITKNGLKPILVEPNPQTFELDDSLIEQAITSRTKAILLVHLYGKCAYTDKLASLCQKYHLKLVEDNAQAHGCYFRHRRTGSLGNAAGHSFYPGKNLGAFGDAGAVTTDDEVLSSTVRTLANYGSMRKYVFQYAGVNSRMDEIQAAVLNIKLKYLDVENEKRRQKAQFYLSNIINPIIQLPVINNWESNVFHIFPIHCNRRDDLQKYLAAKGIQTLIHYPIPPHKQTCYKEWNNLSFPITERLHDEELSLPMSPTLDHNELQYVVDAINQFE